MSNTEDAQGKWHRNPWLDGRPFCQCTDGRHLSAASLLYGEQLPYLNALEAENARLREQVARQRVWAQVGMRGKAEDDQANADKLVAIDQLVADLEAERDALRAKAALADEQYGEGKVRSYAYWKARYDAITAQAGEQG